MSPRRADLRLLLLGTLAVALIAWLVIGSRPRDANVDSHTTTPDEGRDAALPGAAPTLAGAVADDTAGPDVSAPSPWSVTGRVQYPGRRPAVGVEVFLYAERDDRQPAATTRTNTDGAYRLPMPPGERSGNHVVRLIARDGEGNVATYEAYNIKVPRTEDLAVRTLLLQPSNELAVRVLADGQPVEAAEVELSHSSTVRHGLVAVQTTDTEGAVAFADLEPVTYKVHITPPGRPPLDTLVALPWEGEGPLVIDIGLPRELVVRVVRDADETPIADVSVGVLRHIHWGRTATRTRVVAGDDALRTDARGEVRFDNLDRWPDLVVGVAAPGLARAWWNAREKNWQPMWTRTIPVPATDDVVIVRVPRGRTVAWPLVEGDGPLLAEGVVVRLDAGPASQRPYGVDVGRIEGGQLVVEGLQDEPFRARAVAPDGRVARVYVDRASTTGEPVAFWSPRTLIVNVREDGDVPSERIAIRLDALDGPQIATPFASTDEGGVARWDGLPALQGSVSAQRGRATNKAVDLRKGNQEITLEQQSTGGPSQPAHETRLLVRIGGAARLPDAPRVDAPVWDGSWIRIAREDEAAGALVVTWLGKDAQAPATFALQGEGLQAVTFELTPDVHEASVVMERGHRLSAVVLTEPGQKVSPLLQVAASASGPWQAVDVSRGSRLGEDRLPLTPRDRGFEIRYGGLASGWYRLRDRASQRESEPAWVDGAENPTRLVLDARPLGAVAGTVVVPAGNALALARIELSAGDHRTLVALEADGSFRIAWPDGATEVGLVARHPLLVPAPRTGRVSLSQPRDGVRLELVEGAVAEVELAPQGEKLHPRATPTVLLFDAAHPEAAPQELPGRLEGAGDGRFVLSFAGYDPGRWTVWCDAFVGAAPVRLEGARLDGLGALLGPVAVRAGSRIVLRIPGTDGKPAAMLVLQAEYEGQPAHKRQAAVANQPEISVVGLEAGRWHVTGGPLDIAKDEVIQTLDEVIEVDGTSTYER